MLQLSPKASLALRSPALLVAVTVEYGDCANINQMLFRLISYAGCYSDSHLRKPRYFRA